MLNYLIWSHLKLSMLVRSLHEDLGEDMEA